MVFADIFMVQRVEYQAYDRQVLFAFILVISDASWPPRRLFVFIRIPSLLDVYIFILPPFDSWPFSWRILCLLEYGALHYFVCSILWMFLWNHEGKKKVGQVSKVKCSRVEQLYGLSGEDCRGRERVITSGDSRYPGARTGISTGLMLLVLIDTIPPAKRAGERIRRNPDAWELTQPPPPLEGRTLKDAWKRCGSVSTKRFPTCRLDLHSWMGRCRYGTPWLKMYNLRVIQELWPMRFATVMPSDEPSFFENEIKIWSRPQVDTWGWV